MRVFAVSLMALALGACAAAPVPPFVGADPAEASVRVPATSYRPSTGPYISLRAVDPKPWRKQNEDVAPTPKP